MINIVHAWNFMYENDHSYELLLFMYDILNHGYERLLIMDDQYWSVHHIMTPSLHSLHVRGNINVVLNFSITTCDIFVSQLLLPHCLLLNRSLFLQTFGVSVIRKVECLSCSDCHRWLQIAATWTLSTVADSVVASMNVGTHFGDHILLLSRLNHK